MTRELFEENSNEGSKEKKKAPEKKGVLSRLFGKK